MAALREYYYNHQLRNYLIQFMALFAGLRVEVGKTEDKEPRLVKVPIMSASKDRVVAAIKGENTQNKPIRLPTMSAYVNNFDLAPELRHGVGGKRRNTFMPSGGLFPDDIKVVEQRMPVPYRASFELGIWASNQDQHYQLLEQILMLFDPILQIQTTDEPFDWTKITTVELVGVRLDENVPHGSDRRMIKTFLDFVAPVYLSVPADVHQRYVKDIYLRIGAVQTASVTSEDIIADLDAQGIEYDLVFTLDDIDIGEDN